MNPAWPGVVVLVKPTLPQRPVTVVTRELEDRRVAETKRRIKAIDQAARQFRGGNRRRLRRMQSRWGHD
jgi:hypothetical protein